MALPCCGYCSLKMAVWLELLRKRSPMCQRSPDENTNRSRSSDTSSKIVSTQASQAPFCRLIADKIGTGTCTILKS